MADPAWETWLAKFPEVPPPSVSLLWWTAARLADRLDRIPGRPRRADRNAIRDWLRDYSTSLTRAQREPTKIFNPGEMLGGASILTGLLVGFIVPPVLVGTFVVSMGLMARDMAQRAESREREEAIDRIEELLIEIDRRLR